MSDEIQQFSDIITGTFSNIRLEDARKAHSLVGAWKTVLCRIRSNSNPHEGANLSSHSRVIDVRNGVLVVEADHPGWISLLRMHRSFILGGLRRELPQLDIHTIAFKLKGKGAEAQTAGTYSAEQVRRQLEARLEQEQAALEAVPVPPSPDEPVPRGQKELPPELAVIFQDLKKSMLTNHKK